METGGPIYTIENTGALEKTKMVYISIFNSKMYFACLNRFMHEIMDKYVMSDG
jgi:hypothetical protein